MKNLSTRAKILLAVVGVVIVVVAAGLAMTQSGGSDLSGSGVIVISPSAFSLHVGVDTQKLTVNSLFGCNWSSSNTAVATFVGDTSKVKSVTVTGVGVGSATITADCTAANPKANLVVYPPHTGTPTTTPTITPVPPSRTPTRTPSPSATPTPTGIWLNPSNITVGKNSIVNYAVQNYGSAKCSNWYSSKGVISTVGQYQGSLYVEGYTGIEGTGYISVVCNGQEVRASITVQ